MSELVWSQEEISEDRFVIDNDQKAEWAIRKIAEAKADAEAWKQFYKQRLKQVQEDMEANISNLEYMLGEYFRMVPHKKTKTQESYQLPGGKLVLKRQEPEYSVDDDTLVAWLKKNYPEFVKVQESPDWNGLKKITTCIEGAVYTENGKVEGVTATSRPDIFKVEVK